MTSAFDLKQHCAAAASGGSPVCCSHSRTGEELKSEWSGSTTSSGLGVVLGVGLGLGVGVGLGLGFRVRVRVKLVFFDLDRRRSWAGGGRG